MIMVWIDLVVYLIFNKIIINYKVNIIVVIIIIIKYIIIQSNSKIENQVILWFPKIIPLI